MEKTKKVEPRANEARKSQLVVNFQINRTIAAGVSIEIYVMTHKKVTLR